MVCEVANAPYGPWQGDLTNTFSTSSASLSRSPDRTPAPFTVCTISSHLLDSTRPTQLDTPRPHPPPRPASASPSHAAHRKTRATAPHPLSFLASTRWDPALETCKPVAPGQIGKQRTEQSRAAQRTHGRTAMSQESSSTRREHVCCGAAILSGLGTCVEYS